MTNSLAERDKRLAHLYENIEWLSLSEEDGERVKAMLRAAYALGRYPRR